MTRILITVLLSGMVIGTSAQSLDSKVTTGVVSFDSGDCERALKALDQALEQPSALKEKNQPKAYYYRAIARICHARNLALDNNLPELEKLGDFLMMSIEDLQAAQKVDNGK